MKVCIIGAGSSGLVAAKILRENKITFDWFEMGSGIGGNWRYNNDNGRSVAYDSLHINTSKDRMAFADFPMPKEFPDFPHHSQVLEYFESYAKHFGLLSLITFRTAVEQVEPLANGGYKVCTKQLDTGGKTIAHYAAVLICNGHHWCPKMPHFAGKFSGEMLHSCGYRNADNLQNKRVLVLGVGNSGVDIACDVTTVAANVFLASRRGAHIIPRYLLGRPTDQWTTPFFSRFPFKLQQLFFTLLVWLGRGRQANYGMPAPPTKILTEHPTLSTELLPLIKAGKITPKPAVAYLNGTEVVFSDGSLEKIDVLICATGYRISFPFLADHILAVTENHVPLYGKVVHPDFPGLYFIGLIQPLGAIMPLAEHQAKWVAGLISGQLRLPTGDEMRRAIANDQTMLVQRYVPSTRHTIQVDFFPYKQWLERQYQYVCKR